MKQIYKLLYVVVFCVAMTETGKHTIRDWNTCTTVDRVQRKKQLKHVLEQAKVTGKAPFFEYVQEFSRRICSYPITAQNTKYSVLISALLLSALAYNHYAHELPANALLDIANVHNCAFCNIYDSDIINAALLLDTVHIENLEEIRTLFGDAVAGYLTQALEELMIPKH